MKTIIAGSRDMVDYDFFLEVVKTCPWEITEVVSGGARGVDALGERYAHENGIKLTKFPADWDGLGSAAGPIRNVKMAEYADAALLVWNGVSKGTGHMLETSLKRGLTVCCTKYSV